MAKFKKFFNTDLNKKITKDDLQKRSLEEIEMDRWRQLIKVYGLPEEMLGLPKSIFWHRLCLAMANDLINGFQTAEGGRPKNYTDYEDYDIASLVKMMMQYRKQVQKRKMTVKEVCEEIRLPELKYIKEYLTGQHEGGDKEGAFGLVASLCSKTYKYEVTSDQIRARYNAHKKFLKTHPIKDSPIAQTMYWAILSETPRPDRFKVTDQGRRASR